MMVCSGLFPGPMALACPSAKEKQISLDFIKDYGDRRAEAIQDLMWALLNQKDFLLLH